nr:MAG TPA: hypothetical protein [Ackermannviridae sp.]
MKFSSHLKCSFVKFKKMINWRLVPNDAILKS